VPPAPPVAPRAALVSAFGCYVMWGFMPLLFMAQAAAGFDSLEILAHRALWAVAVAGLLVLLAKQGGQVRAVLTSPKTLGWLVLSTALIGVNWGLYVWATTHEATLEASLGYYINPLLNMVVGLWLFREKIDKWGWVAIGLAAVGVLFQTLALGRPPWISLVLAFSFASYGVIRKRVPIDAQAGLLVECLLLVPFGLAWVLWLQHTGAGVAFDSPGNTLWALPTARPPSCPWPCSPGRPGACRCRPSASSSSSPRRSSSGSGLATGEALTPLRVISFAFIWGGAGVFAAAAFFRHRAAREALKRCAEPV
jgi:chloramphenicol-sensitive protein RarD